MKYTNKNNLPFALAVMLATDKYKHSSDPKTIGVTTLMGSPRSVILTKRIPAHEQTVDISQLLASRMGTALHDALEAAWLNPELNDVLESLGIPARVRDKVRVNPEKHDPDMINIYLELRTEKKINGWTVTGQLDLVINGRLKDLKSTGTFKFNKENIEFVQQLSIYKWLNPEIVFDEEGDILFWFKDWNKFSALKADYPSQPLVEQPYTLLPLATAEAYVAKKLALLDEHENTPMADLPRCTRTELWQAPPKYNYYGSPENVKASKSFDNLIEANNWKLGKGKGLIRVIEAEPTKCMWCAASRTCDQAKGYVAQGILTLTV